MAKKKIKTAPVVIHYCGECRRGEWVDKHSNLDIYGKPICVRCDKSEFARLRDERACEYFQRK